ncbi:hypothetical protein F5Y15DRAFT_381097 [Xylariaceae sp. FL0016]|nr:hypothetical protein F5Y15DRAFT_381097 [Xylariaceae sp. FL0016]
MHTSVCDTLSWVQEKYVAHCRKYSSGSVNPENVKFKILACEWSLEQKLAPPRHEQPRAIKKRPRARISALSDMFVNLSLDTTTNHKNPSFPSILPVVFGDKGASSFEFKMEVPHGKPLSVRGWWR